MIGPRAPVLVTGPCSSETPHMRSQAAILVGSASVTKQRSAEPGVGCAAFGSSSWPAWCRFSFCSPKVSAAAGAEDDLGHPQDTGVEADGVLDRHDCEDEVVEPGEGRCGCRFDRDAVVVGCHHAGGVACFGLHVSVRASAWNWRPDGPACAALASASRCDRVRPCPSTGVRSRATGGEAGVRSPPVAWSPARPLDVGRCSRVRDRSRTQGCG